MDYKAFSIPEKPIDFKREIKIINNPIDRVLKKFKELPYYNYSLIIEFRDDLENQNLFGQFDPWKSIPKIKITNNQPIHNTAYILAHELAHVCHYCECGCPQFGDIIHPDKHNFYKDPHGERFEYWFDQLKKPLEFCSYKIQFLPKVEFVDSKIEKML